MHSLLQQAKDVRTYVRMCVWTLAENIQRGSDESRPGRTQIGAPQHHEVHPHASPPTFARRSCRARQALATPRDLPSPLLAKQTVYVLAERSVSGRSRASPGALEESVCACGR